MLSAVTEFLTHSNKTPKTFKSSEMSSDDAHVLTSEESLAIMLGKEKERREG